MLDLWNPIYQIAFVRLLKSKGGLRIHFARAINHDRQKPINYIPTWKFKIDLLSTKCILLVQAGKSTTSAHFMLISIFILLKTDTSYSRAGCINIRGTRNESSHRDNISYARFSWACGIIMRVVVWLFVVLSWEWWYDYLWYYHESGGMIICGIIMRVVVWLFVVLSWEWCYDYLWYYHESGGMIICGIIMRVVVWLFVVLSWEWWYDYLWYYHESGGMIICGIIMRVVVWLFVVLSWEWCYDYLWYYHESGAMIICGIIMRVVLWLFVVLSWEWCYDYLWYYHESGGMIICGIIMRVVLYGTYHACHIPYVTTHHYRGTLLPAGKPTLPAQEYGIISDIHKVNCKGNGCNCPTVGPIDDPCVFVIVIDKPTLVEYTVSYWDVPKWFLHM